MKVLIFLVAMFISLESISELVDNSVLASPKNSIVLEDYHDDLERIYLMLTDKMSSNQKIYELELKRFESKISEKNTEIEVLQGRLDHASEDLRIVKESLVALQVRGNGWDSFISIVLTVVTIILAVFAFLVGAASFFGKKEVERLIRQDILQKFDDMSTVQLEPKLKKALTDSLMDPRDRYDLEGNVREPSEYQTRLERILEIKVNDSVERFLYRGVSDD